MRSVCVVTGTRAEYGILTRLLRLIQDADDLDLHVVAAGMHLSPEYGLTVKEIEADGFPVEARVDMLFSSDRTSAMAKGVGIGIYGLAQAFESIGVDLVLVIGDRVEAFAGAAAAALSNIVVAHIHGGDRSQGGLDESMRHSITKLSHYHFVATETSGERVRRMGEKPEHVFLVGSPDLDEILQTEFMNPDDLGRHFNFDFGQDVVVVVQHPVSTKPEEASTQIRETLEAIKTLQVQTVLVRPNSDAGSRAMVNTINEYRGLPNLRVVQTLRREQYLSLLRHARVLVGNSSSGIIEAPFLGTPVVNIGSRQAGREQAVRTLQADYDRGEIVARVKEALYDPAVRQTLEKVRYVYGDGHASEQMLELIRTLPLDASVKQKIISY